MKKPMNQEQKEQYKKYQKQYRKKHSVELRKVNKQYYLDHREELIAQHAEYAKQNYGWTHLYHLKLDKVARQLMIWHKRITSLNFKI